MKPTEQRRTRATRLVLASLATTLGALTFATAPALAAAPEQPTAEPTSAVTATTATLNGILSPNSPGELGSTYQFLYRASTKGECKGAGEIKAPASPAMSIGAQGEPVSEPVTALKPGSEYAVCLVVHNQADTEEALSSPVTFVTVPAPSTETPTPIGATTATFKGKLTPPSSVGAEYVFFYNLGEEAACTNEQATPVESAEPVSTAVTGLEPDEKYTVCLFVFNAFGGEEASLVHFTTQPAPPEVLAESESASPVRASEATLNAVINPNNEKTPYFFEYAKTEAAIGTSGATRVSGTPELEGYGGQGASVGTGAVLAANTTYYYRVVAENAQSKTEAKAVDGSVRSFTTTTPSQEEAIAITGTTVTLHGVLNPVKAGEADSYEFLYRASPTECEGESVTPSTSASGGQAEAVEAELTGLLPHAQYTFCLLAHNEVGEAAAGPAVTFTTAAVGITTEASSEVGSTSTKLSAQIDPGEAATNYYVEYGPSQAYGFSTPVASAGAGSGYVSVQATLGELQPNTVYHYRFVAKSSFGAAPGPDATFTTFAPASGLPDNRGYELVSVFPSGSDIEAYLPEILEIPYIQANEHGIHTGHQFRVASDGDAVVFPGDPSPTGGDGSRGVTNGNQYLSTRTASGWETTNIQPAGIPAAQYGAFSSDLSVAILSAEHVALTEDAPEGYSDLYTHALTGGASGENHPFNTSTPPNRSPAEFSLGNEGYSGGNAGTSVVPAYSHLLFEANDALRTMNVPAAGGSGEDPSSHLQFGQEENLYDSVGGGLYLVNVLPDGTTEANAAFGAPPAIIFNPHDVSHAISADGSRIFWSATEGPQSERRIKALYVRENDTSPDASTVLIAQGGEFWTASSEGSLAFYTKEGKLYSFDVETEQTTNLSVDLNPPEKAEVQGVVGASEDGEYVYFVARGKLASNANANKEDARAGADNLYLSYNGTTTFIARLQPGDGCAVAPLSECHYGEPATGDWQSDAGYRTAEVTPDGHSLVFVSNQPLTGYDPGTQQRSATGEDLDEVFLFQAQSGTLTCVSCNPSGEPPVPTEFNTHYYDDPIGGFIPISRSHAGEQPRVISEDGDRVFFDSGEPLLPTATNGWLNVYEWERAGTPGGSCPEGAPNGGCIYLISSGSDPETSYLLGADASGNNVFFYSNAELVAADRGGDDYQVYDARVDGGQPPGESSCSGTGCQGVPPSPPIFATPSSVTFNGVGNYPPSSRPGVVVKPLTRARKLAKALKACEKDKSRKQRTRCDASARRKYGATKAGKASNKRRASR